MTGSDTVTRCRLPAASLAASTKRCLSWWAFACFPCKLPPDRNEHSKTWCMSGISRTP